MIGGDVRERFRIQTVSCDPLFLQSRGRLPTRLEGERSFYCRVIQAKDKEGEKEFV